MVKPNPRATKSHMPTNADILRELTESPTRSEILAELRDFRKEYNESSLKLAQSLADYKIHQEQRHGELSGRITQLETFRDTIIKQLAEINGCLVGWDKLFKGNGQVGYFERQNRIDEFIKSFKESRENFKNRFLYPVLVYATIGLLSAASGAAIGIYVALKGHIP